MSAATTISFTVHEAQTLEAAIGILQKKLQEEGGAVSTAAPARKGGKRSPNQAAIDSVIARRRKRFDK